MHSNTTAADARLQSLENAIPPQLKVAFSVSKSTVESRLYDICSYLPGIPPSAIQIRTGTVIGIALTHTQTVFSITFGGLEAQFVVTLSQSIPVEVIWYDYDPTYNPQAMIAPVPIGRRLP